MSPFEQFRRELRQALAHLHDPDYQPSELLCSVLGLAPHGDSGLIQATIIQAVEQPTVLEGAPAAVRTEKDDEILRHRYLLRLTQEETADRLYMSVRSVRRAQRIATHALARQIWEQRLVQGTTPDKDTDVEAQGSWPIEDSANWHLQVREELAALQSNSPEAVADVEEALKWAVNLEGPLLAAQGNSLTIHTDPNRILAAMHPTVLRQTLIMAISQMTQDCRAGPIEVSATSTSDKVEITIDCPPISVNRIPDIQTIEEIVSLHDGLTEMTTNDEESILKLSIHSAGKTTVVVIDDNSDLVHYYGRCATGTRYRIVQAVQGQRTIKAIAALIPDIVVLDIMLPDADGWELLNQLQKNPATRTVPVIVCSIVMEEKLAIALGACTYLRKPVARNDFIQALDHAAARMQAGLVREPV